MSTTKRLSSSSSPDFEVTQEKSAFSSTSIPRLAFKDKTKKLTREDIIALINEAKKRKMAVDLSHRDLKHINLSKLDFFGHKSLSNYIIPNFEGADLSYADLRGANLSCAFFREARLFKADLRDTNLNDSVLMKTDLRGADLRDAKLVWCRVDDANFSFAKLKGTNFSLLTGLDKAIGLDDIK